jgi:uncharacterized protein YbjT (DUF2867 family)
MTLSRAVLCTLVVSCCWVLALAGDHSGPGKVLVVGATGETGRLIVPKLLESRYAVRAFVRDTGKGREVLGENVELVAGDIRHPATIAAALVGVNYVVSAVGASAASGENRPETVDYEGVKNLADASGRADVKQLVLISSMGVTEKDHQLNKFFGNVLKWKARGEQALRDSGVPYTVVRPGGLTNQPGGQVRVVAVQGDPPMDNARIPRADLAAVCVAALTSPAARYKTLEVFTEPGKPITDWNAFFATLDRDPN